MKSVVERVDDFLATEFPGANTVIFRDLTLNFKKLLEQSSLDPREGFLNLLSVAVALENRTLVQLAKQVLTDLAIEAETIQEAAEIAGIMGMNNVYYKFKSALPAELAAADYPRAGLRMSSIAQPVNSKKDFEMMALSVSIVNACAVCVVSHEKTARQHGVTPDQIHDLARLAAVAKGLTSLKKAMTL